MGIQRNAANQNERQTQYQTKSIKQSSLNFDFLKNKKYDANDMDTID